MKKGIMTAVLISIFSMAVLAGTEETYFQGGKGADTTRKEVMKELNLSQDQKDKIKVLTEETKTKIKDLSGQNLSREDFIDGMKNIKEEQRAELNTILNEKQQKIVASEMNSMEKRKADFEKNLNLTEEQKSQINSIRDDYYQKMQDVKNQGLTEKQQKDEMKRLFMEETKERDKILTDKQKAFLKSTMNKMR